MAAALRVVMAVAAVLATLAAPACSLSFRVTLAAPLPQPPPALGRLFVALSTNTSTDAPEPRRLVSDEQDTQQLFGQDVDLLALVRDSTSASSTDLVLSDANGAFGFPVPALAQIASRLVPAGQSIQLRVQAVLQPYQTYNRSVGPPVQLPRIAVNAVEGGAVLTAPGTLFSAPATITLTGSSEPQVVNLTLTSVDPPAPPPPADTDYIKHVTVTSPELSRFWGTPINLTACVLLPFGFHNHTDARYPLFLYHGHYHDDWATPVPFSESPPDPSLTGYAREQAQYAYYLFRNWTSSRPDSPFFRRRGLIVTIKHANPFYDDSYAVNSANLGPYGDAILALVQQVERQFRGLGQPWARTTYGGSTGGWESFAVQVFNPRFFAGAFSFCPDPLDFRAYTSIDIYASSNAYFYDAPWKRTPRPGQRDEPSNEIYPGYGRPFGATTATVEEMNHRELAQGQHSRSTGQYDIWEAVFSPMNSSSGYPARLYDKRSGQINPEVAAYWRENYDLRFILQRDWASLGPQLVNKLHLFVGASDTYFLNNAVMLMQDFLESTTAPYYNGSVAFGAHDGRGFEHCWSGDNTIPNSLARLTINQRLIPTMVQRMLDEAPAGADTESWRY